MTNVDAAEKLYLTIKEFSRLTGLSESTIRRRVQDGSLPALQPGGTRTRVLFARNALELAAALPTPPTTTHTIPPPSPRGPRPRWMGGR